jgi:dTDP-6-deoxy-L-talose 4-dehydrogenase (NAD+)
MKFLITGATGFIGNHLINELLKNPKNQVIATSRDIKKARQCKWYNRVRYIEYIIDSNSADLNLYTLFEKPDYLIHLSWDGLPNYESLSHIENNIYNNYSFIKNLIKNGLKSLSVSGTCFEYGLVDGELSEDMNSQPSNPYSMAKDTLRKFFEELNKKYEFDLKWIRLFYMYGYGQAKNSLLALLDVAIRDGEKAFNMSKGDQLRDYLPVSEVAKNIILISKQNNISGIINCCSNNLISIVELVENYLKERNYSLKLNLGYYLYLKLEPMSFWGSNKKLNLIRELDG